MPHIRTGITESQIEALEEVFAKPTAQGWIVPEWLVMLRAAVTGEEVEIIDDTEQDAPGVS